MWPVISPCGMIEASWTKRSVTIAAIACPASWIATLRSGGKRMGIQPSSTMGCIARCSATGPAREITALLKTYSRALFTQPEFAFPLGEEHDPLRFNLVVRRFAHLPEVQP